MNYLGWWSSPLAQSLLAWILAISERVDRDKDTRVEPEEATEGENQKDSALVAEEENEISDF